MKGISVCWLHLLLLCMTWQQSTSFLTHHSTVVRKTENPYSRSFHIHESSKDKESIHSDNDDFLTEKGLQRVYNPYERSKVINVPTTQSQELIQTLLTKLRSSSASSTSEGVKEEMSVTEIQAKYESIFQSLRQLDIEAEEKVSIWMEVKHALLSNDDNDDNDNDDAVKGKKKASQGTEGLSRLPVSYHKTALFLPSQAPLLVVYGTGKVGQEVVKMLQSLGKVTEKQVKFVEASSLSALRDVELNLLLENVKSIVLAVDSAVKVKKNWFGQIEVEEDETRQLSQKALQRLLNVAMKESRKQEQKKEEGIKVVCLGKACKPPKSVASYLMGDTTTLESETTLECMQRTLGYLVIKIGQPWEENDPAPTKVKERGIAKEINEIPSGKGSRVINNPSVAFTTSTVVESNEYTTVKTAAEALLRAVTYPNRNSSVSVLSTSITETPSNIDWDDEFLKLDGPELTRIPFKFADDRQVSLMVKRLADRLKLPGLGLITPIDIEMFANGVRIIFKPVESTYKSSKEEFEEEQVRKKQEDEEQQRKPPNVKVVQSKGYIAPEKDQEELDEMIALSDLRNQVQRGSSPIKNESKPPESSTPSKKKAPLEGGLDIVVESSPYTRVRVRRCLMGPTTIPKEESESIILKLIRQYANTLENDVRILYSDLQ